MLLGCLTSSSRRVGSVSAAVPQNRFEGCAGCETRGMSFGSLLQFTHYSVASRMTPERHDDVEDVVGRARGDVPPEETHEPALLISLVERNVP